MHSIFQRKSVKIFLISLGIVIISVFFGIDNSKALLGYIQTKIITENNEEFVVNGVKGQYTSIALNDNIATLEGSVTFVLNGISTVTILPHSQVQFLKLGESPIVRIIDGTLDTQSISNVTIYSGDSIAIVDQGALRVKKSDTYSQFGNYYGSSVLSIFDSQKNHILSYNLPIQKQVTIFDARDKSSWNKILYSKLNKEMSLIPFKEAIVRETFSAQAPTVPNSAPNWLETHLTVNPQKQKGFQAARFYEITQQLLNSIENKSPALIRVHFQEIGNYYENNEQEILQKILFSIQDPLIRYVYENEFLKAYKKDTSSLSIELKYLYSILSMNNPSYEEKIYEALEAKMTSHKNNVNKLAEDYNLLSSLLEAYPALTTAKILDIKSSLEKTEWLLTKNITEKNDLLLQTFEYDLHFISLLVENNKGDLARKVYDNSLMSKVNFDESNIAEYKDRLQAKIDESFQYLQFYEEELHSAAYNEEIFNHFKERKGKEEAAIQIYSKNNIPLRSRPINTDFSDIIKVFKKQTIQVLPQNISFAFNTGKLLFIQNALLEGTELSFDCVYNQETQTVSSVNWKNNTILPPMNDDIPLSKFQESYNALLSMKIPEETKKEKIVADWAAGIDNSYNYEFDIKKRLTKEKLESLGIASKEGDMQLFGNSIEIREANFLYNNEKQEEAKVVATLRFDVKSWELLGAQLQEFPERKIRITSLDTLKSELINADQEERNRLTLKEEALRELQSFVPDIRIENISIKNFEGKIVHIQPVPIFITQKDEERVFRISGDFNVQTAIFNNLHINFEDMNKDISSIPLAQLLNTIERIFSIQKTAVSAALSKSDLEKSIQESIPKSNDISEKEIQDVKKILENGQWINE